MTDDSYPHTFKKRVQIQKRGGISHWGGDLHSSCMFADFFLRKGDQSLLRGGTWVLLSGSFRPLIVLMIYLSYFWNGVWQ